MGINNELLCRCILVTVYVNEEGSMKNLPPNTAATIIFEYPLVGNVVMVADNDEMNKEFEHEADEDDNARVPYLHPLGTLAKLDDEADVLSPLDDMMDRHRKRLESEDEEPPRFYKRLDNYDPAGH